MILQLLLSRNRGKIKNNESKRALPMAITQTGSYSLLSLNAEMI